MVSELVSGTSVEVKLANCPFCDAPPHWLSKTPGGRDGEFEARLRALGCDNAACGVKPQTPFKSPEKFVPGKGYIPVDHDAEHIEAWNRRALIQPTPAETEGARKLAEAAEMVLDWWHEWHDKAPEPEEVVAFEALESALSEVRHE